MFGRFRLFRVFVLLSLFLCLLFLLFMFFLFCCFLWVCFVDSANAGVIIFVVSGFWGGLRTTVRGATGSTSLMRGCVDVSVVNIGEGGLSLALLFCVLTPPR